MSKMGNYFMGLQEEKVHEQQDNWADNVVKNLWNLHGVFISNENLPVVVNALRKAKAAGMREAGRLCSDRAFNPDCRWSMEEFLLPVADKIEKGLV